MVLKKFMALAFYCINFLCWTVGKYLLINVNVENQEDVVGTPENEYYQWNELQDNESISLSSDISRDMYGQSSRCNHQICNPK